METKKSICGCLTSSALLFCNSVSAQIPVEQEPHHKVIFENEYVRLIDLRMAVGDTSLVHTHSAASVVVFLTKSSFGIQNLGEPGNVVDVNPGDIIYRDYDERPVTHTVWNPSKSFFRCFVAEMLQKQSGDNASAILADSGLTFQFEQKRVRVYNLEVSKGMRSILPKSNSGYFLITVSGVATVLGSGKKSVLQMADYAFFPPRTDIAIEGNDIETAKFVVLQLR